MEVAAQVYRLADGASLVLRAGDAPWQAVVFDHTLFADIGAASADEVAAVIDELDGVNAFVGEDGRLVLASQETGEHARVEVDIPLSTAAAALGLTGTGIACACGAGPGAARLLGSATQPFRLPGNAAMTVHVDGRARRIDFGAGKTHTAATAAEVINTKLRRDVARPTGDGRVLLVSPTIGAGTRLSVTAPADVPDAAVVLGFTGDTASAEPYRSVPARLDCPAAPSTAVVHNATGAPIELQLPAGRAVLPAGGQLTLTMATAMDAVVLRLVALGAARVTTPGKDRTH